ncbi:LutC/YkgG family protein [Jatrophihabitans sp.]|uniref:LutC/YkgG family protein n=1 Tax=Jatrophihabitans sp. TaxID=1932789 RepID=UPI002CC4CBAE|nr:LUD domain-containing protein [Jatrophihabitans sp.]
MTAREEVLARIRSALAGGSEGSAATGPAEIPRHYRHAGAPAAGPAEADSAGTGPAEGADLVELLVDRLVDYRASVTRTEPAEVPAVLAQRLAGHGIGSVLVPDGFPAEWLAASTAEQRTDEALTPAQLDRIDGVVCTCRLAIAETGTIVLDSGPGQGRRAVSLVPDYLLVVLHAGHVVAGVPEAVAELGPARQPDPGRPGEPSRPLTWISGPSATSDIELNRVEGVHGPRTLDVILVQAEPAGAAPPEGDRAAAG